MIELRLPELGENIESVDVSAVLVREGDRVARDQPVIEVETEKASLEVPADSDGLVVEGPRPLTYGRDTLPVYCCHEPVMERASIEATGVPLFVVDPSDRLGEEPCRTYLYKDPAKIPERFYERLGLTKPKP